MPHTTPAGRVSRQFRDAADDAAGTAPGNDAAGLDRLAAEVDPSQFTAVLVTGQDRRPCLRITSRHTGLLSEDICTAHGWFWFSWAERITATDDAAGAAAAITRVLAAGHSPGQRP